MIILRLLILGLLIAATTPETAAHEPSGAMDGPADNYVYQLAAPGTYQLPVIKSAATGMVLDEHGREHELKDLLIGRLTILAFVYTRCADLCPLATMRLAQLRDLATSSFNGNLSLITMSFDPDHDTPQRMAEFGEPWRSEKMSDISWLFLTARNRVSIKPLLAAYNQPVAAPTGDSSAGMGSISHLMRVFLIDDVARIRNIYSPDFLDPRLLLNDLLTLERAQKD
jgi:cytochrome oxidase Cu insertion factor (SCO1/SenC/PrrC family)